MASSSSSRHVAPKFGKVAVHNFPLSYYYKVATASFVCGAAVEAFMIHTYDSLMNYYLFFFNALENSKINTPLTHTLFYSLSLSLFYSYRNSGFYEKVTQIEANRRADFSSEQTVSSSSSSSPFSSGK
jgi:hypothetical protein